MTTTETTATSGAIIPLPPAYVSKPLSDIVKAELTPIQQGWLSFCDYRERTFNSLLRGELEIQNLFNTVTADTPLADMQETLKKIKSLYDERKNERLLFTNKLKDKVIDASMEFEKRSEELVDKLTKLELDTRVAAEAVANKTKNLDLEKAAYKAHVINENLRIKTEYCNALERRVAFYYTNAITPGSKKMTKKELGEHYADIKKELAQIELSKPIAYNRVLVDIPMAKEILATVVMYDPAPDLLAYQNKVETAFAMYEQDFKNPVAAIAATNNSVEQTINTNTQQAEVEQLTNNIAAAASTFEMTGGPVVRRKRAVIIENTPEWAMSVIANFTRLFNMAAPKLQNKTWEKLTLGQMCGAFNKLLADNDKLVLTGLQTEEIKK